MSNSERGEERTNHDNPGDYCILHSLKTILEERAAQWNSFLICGEDCNSLWKHFTKTVKIDQLEGTMYVIPGPDIPEQPFVKFAHRCSFPFSHCTSPLLFHPLFLALHPNWMNTRNRLNITLYVVQIVTHFLYVKSENLAIHEDNILKQMILNILNCCLLHNIVILWETWCW